MQFETAQSVQLPLDTLYPASQLEQVQPDEYPVHLEIPQPVQLPLDVLYPASQLEHVQPDEYPVHFATVQSVQPADASADVFPAGHVLHSEPLSTSEYLPAGQGCQSIPSGQ